MSTEAFVNTIALFGPTMPWVVAGLKKIFPTVEGRYIAQGYAVFLGILSTVTWLILGQETYLQIVAEGVAVGGIIFKIGTSLYNGQKK